MLMKLMKYELKATSRLLVPLYLILLCITILDRFVFRLDIFHEPFGIVPSFLIFAYIILIVIIFTVTFLLMIIRFYKNLLTDEGYLMFTLPANTNHLIISKLLITLFWFIVSLSSILVSLYIVFATPDRMNIVMNELKEFMNELNAVEGNGILLLIEFALICILSLVGNILMIYVSIAIGQLVTGHKIIGSFVSYIAITAAIQFLMVIVILIFGIANLDNSGSIGTIPRFLLPLCICFATLECIGFYAVTNYVFKKRLNLE